MSLPQHPNHERKESTFGPRVFHFNLNMNPGIAYSICRLPYSFLECIGKKSWSFDQVDLELQFDPPFEEEDQMVNR